MKERSEDVEKASQTLRTRGKFSHPWQAGQAPHRKHRQSEQAQAEREAELGSLSDFYKNHPRLRAVIEAVLDGRLGSVRVLEDPPRAARLDLGCYAVPGGDPTSSSARTLLTELTGPLEIVVPDDDRWRQLLADVFGTRIRDRSMQAYVGDALSTEKLDKMSTSLSARYELVPMGVAEATALGGDLSPHGVDVFGGPENFVRTGFGVCALLARSPVCAASTYALTADKAEVAIATREDHRGQGLATAVGAAMLAECQQRGHLPHWNAYNPISQRLALRLGLTPIGICEILMLDG
jgi:GNAT superfamily N-acetyltransferase